jgi:hypothetical protein
MIEKDLTVINIKEHIKDHDQLWLDCLSYIKENCRDDSLYENYLSINLDNFNIFSVAIYNDTIVSFGGLEQRKDRWGEHIFRALTRFWIHPEYRTKSLTKWSSDKIRFSPIILKSQIEYFKDYDNEYAIMITREGKYLRSFQEIIRLANSVSEKTFTMLEGRFNVCSPDYTAPESCKQYIAVTDKKLFYKAQQQGFFKRYE